MNRKQFIESHGASCRNWLWSWSFINVKERVVIFGAWDKDTEGNTALILDEAWARNDVGKKKAGYQESRGNIRLIEEEGYLLKTFPLIHSDERKDANGLGPAKIKEFGQTLSTKFLKKVGGKWYASDGIACHSIPEEVSHSEQYIEGSSNTIAINAYERNAKARAACIRHYGPLCIVCGFNFEAVYGSIGVGYIHVHHLVPLSNIRMEYALDPIRDLRPVCPNCHAMIHTTEPVLSIEQLKVHLSRAGRK